MKYDPNNTGVIDLVQLLRDVLDIRSAAMSVAIDERDVDLAIALNTGIDAGVYRLLLVQLKKLQEEAEAAHNKVHEFTGTFFEHMENMSKLNRLTTRALALEDVCREYEEAIEAMKGIHPMAFERTTPELIELLDEREKTEADKKEPASQEAAG